MVKRLSLLTVASVLSLCVFSQNIKGPESVSYFQAPAEGVKYSTANVFLSNDMELATIKKEEQQARNTAMGSNFGALGAGIAGVANDAMDAMESMNKAIDALKDDKGRFAVWSFVPVYVIAPAETKKEVKVEIFVLNEPNPSPGAGMPTQPGSDGYYDIPYYVNCRYKVTDADGKVIIEENLGILEGTKKTKNYKPQTAATPGASLTQAATDLKNAEKDMAKGNFEDEVPIQDRIGTNVAYNRVRKEIFSRYGFGQFEAPIKLGVIKEHKASKKFIDPTIDIFAKKQGLLLTDAEKAKVQEFANMMEDALKVATEKTKWVALHNLSVCYAWLEDAEKAQNYYTQYGTEIKSTLEKVECWNLVLQKKMTSKEMKEKVGTTFIGTKDLKSYAEYNNIKSFVSYYPTGAKKYPKLMFAINRDLKRFVDFYSVNDLLCQLFEIDYPFQFFPLQDFAGAPKDMKATVTKAGMEPIEYRVKFDMKRKIKELAADQVTTLSDGNKEKLLTRDLMPRYNDAGKYTHFETDAGIWSDPYASSGSHYSSLNYTHDPVAASTFGKAFNITKNGGFLGEKESSETVQLKVDLEGNIYFTGSSNYYKANAFFKELLNSAGVIPKRVDTQTEFTTKANINEQGVITDWRWEGNVTTDFAGALKATEQNMKAKPMVRAIKFVDSDDKGNPVKVEFEQQMKGTLAIEEKAKGMAFVNKYLVDLNMPKPTVSKDGFNFKANGNWDCSFEYDAQGNWTKMVMGPYTATREFKY